MSQKLLTLIQDTCTVKEDCQTSTESEITELPDIPFTNVRIYLQEYNKIIVILILFTAMEPILDNNNNSLTFLSPCS